MGGLSFLSCCWVLCFCFWICTLFGSVFFFSVSFVIFRVCVCKMYVETIESNEIINRIFPWAMFYKIQLLKVCAFWMWCDVFIVYIIHFSARNRISSLACNRSNIYTTNWCARERTNFSLCILYIFFSYFFFLCSIRRRLFFLFLLFLSNCRSMSRCHSNCALQLFLNVKTTKEHFPYFV